MVDSIFKCRCRRLPRSHLFLLGFLMHHLRRVAAEHESNNMTASNLAIVFGPTLLRRNEDTASLITVMETIHQARAVELLTIFVEVRARTVGKTVYWPLNTNKLNPTLPIFTLHLPYCLHSHINKINTNHTDYAYLKDIFGNFQDIFGPPENILPKDYQKYTTNRHANHNQQVGHLHGSGGGQQQPTAKLSSRRSQHQMFEHGSGKWCSRDKEIPCLLMFDKTNTFAFPFFMFIMHNSSLLFIFRW